MKKRMLVLLITLLLTLLLAVPVAASKPTEVSGSRWVNAPPQNRTWRSAGNNCISEVDITYEYDGDLVAEILFQRIEGRRSLVQERCRVIRSDRRKAAVKYRIIQ